MKSKIKTTVIQMLYKRSMSFQELKAAMMNHGLQVSDKYLRHVMSDLRSYGLVKMKYVLDLEQLQKILDENAYNNLKRR